MLRIMFNSLLALCALLLSTNLLAEVDMSATQDQVDALLKAKNQQVEQIRPLLETVQDQEHEVSDEDKTKEKEITAAKEAAQCSAQQFFSKQQDQVKGEMDRVYRTFSGNQQKENQPEQNAEHFELDEAVYVFISSSMPESTIRAYFNQITATKESKIAPVMYGLAKGLGNKSESAQYLSRIMQVDAQCQDAPGAPCDRFPIEILVNPMLFKKYSITSVPSVVYAKGDNWWSVQGDSTLDYLLEKINQDANSPAVEGLITSIRRPQ